MKNKRLRKPKPIPVVLDHSLKERIEALAKRLGEANSVAMRIAMRLGLEALEKTYAETSLSSLPSSIQSIDAAATQPEESPQKQKKKSAA